MRECPGARRGLESEKKRETEGACRSTLTLRITTPPYAHLPKRTLADQLSDVVIVRHGGRPEVGVRDSGKTSAAMRGDAAAGPFAFTPRRLGRPGSGGRRWESGFSVCDCLRAGAWREKETHCCYCGADARDDERGRERGRAPREMSESSFPFLTPFFFVSSPHLQPSNKMSAALASRTALTSAVSARKVSKQATKDGLERVSPRPTRAERMMGGGGDEKKRPAAEEGRPPGSAPCSLPNRHPLLAGPWRSGFRHLARAPGDAWVINLAPYAD